MVALSKEKLNKIYGQYNKRRYIHPDPLEFLCLYENSKDREIAGLVASSLAYGRVAQILKSVSSVLNIMGKSPYYYLCGSTRTSLAKSFTGFRHRFADEKNIASLLYGAKNVIKKYGSLNGCFAEGISKQDTSVLPGMSFFVSRLLSNNGNPGHLLPIPGKGSACKRLNLFLRWMVRKDSVDPGGWKQVDKSKLIVPLDTHMHRIGLEFGFTGRKQADMKTAMEITEGFKKFSPEDPVKYDFALTRFGIRDDMDIGSLLRS